MLFYARLWLEHSKADGSTASLNDFFSYCRILLIRLVDSSSTKLGVTV